MDRKLKQNQFDWGIQQQLCHLHKTITMQLLMKSFNNNLLLKTTKYILWNVRMHMSQIKHVNRLIAANPVSHINMREFYMQTIHTLVLYLNPSRCRFSWL